MPTATPRKQTSAHCVPSTLADSLQADTAALRGAGAWADKAATAASPGAENVQPCAPDAVSVGASTRFTAQVTLARWYTQVANGMARQCGVLLDAGASAYDEQESASAALLGGSGAPLMGSAVMPAVVSEALALLQGGNPDAAPSLPSGEVPGSPRDIARLIDTGRAGPGPRAWQAVADRLRGESGELERAAEQLAAAIAAAQQGWNSVAAEAAVARMRALQSWYEGHAVYVRTLATTAAGHVDDFRMATVQVPDLTAVQTAERELHAANAANARSGGKFAPAVARAQVQLSALYTQAVDGFKNYTFAASATSPQPPPAPPILAPGQNPDPVPVTGRGDEPKVLHKADTAPADSPPDPVDAGTGVGQESLRPGTTWPPGAADPGDLTPSLADALPGAASLAPQMAPAVLGGVVGGAGGLLGGLSSGGGKAMSMPASMMSGLGEPAGGDPQHGGGEPEQAAPQPTGGADDPTPDSGGGGGEPGDTEPAGGTGSLSAPQALATPAAEAAPLSAPTAGSPAPEPAAAAGSPMGAMAPPMMGGPRGGRDGADNKQLYKDRELKVAVPPNSEPVKGRRESRATRDGAGK